MRSREAMKTIKKYRQLQTPCLVCGVLLFVCGAVYSLWAVEQLRNFGGHPGQAFDRPVAQFSQIFVRYQDYVDGVVGHPDTARESWLAQELKRANQMNLRLTLFVLRLLFGMMGASVGSVLLAAGLTTRELLRMIPGKPDAPVGTGGPPPQDLLG